MEPIMENKNEKTVAPMIVEHEETPKHDEIEIEIAQKRGVRSGVRAGTRAERIVIDAG